MKDYSMTATNMISLDGDYDFHGTNLDDSTKTVKFYANKSVLAAEAKRIDQLVSPVVVVASSLSLGVLSLPVSFVLTLSARLSREPSEPFAYCHLETSIWQTLVGF